MSVSIKITLDDVKQSFEKEKKSHRDEIVKMCEIILNKGIECRDLNFGYCPQPSTKKYREQQACCYFAMYGTIQAVLFLVHNCHLTAFFWDHECLRNAIQEKNVDVVKYILGNIWSSHLHIFHEQANWDMSYVFSYWKDTPSFFKVYLGSILEDTWKKIFLNLAQNRMINNDGSYGYPCGSYALKWFKVAFKAYSLAEPMTPLLHDHVFLKEILSTAKTHNGGLYAELCQILPSGGHPDKSFIDSLHVYDHTAC